jgi:hypothetical protein
MFELYNNKQKKEIFNYIKENYKKSPQDIIVDFEGNIIGYITYADKIIEFKEPLRYEKILEVKK